MKDFQSADEITLVHSGSDYFDRLVWLMDEARETIHLQTYIYENDETGQLIAQALKRAAGRGVRVRVLVDGYGSSQLPQSFVQDLQAAGIEFRFFKHVIRLWKWSFGRTLHHKVAVADAYTALVGGINIADKYRGSATVPAWLDFAVLIQGDVCRYLDQMCNSLFFHQYWKRSYRLMPAKNAKSASTRLLRFRQNDWMRGRTEIYLSYRQAIANARHSLIIVASYFLPGYNLRRRLAVAARRGVEVKILLTGPSDVLLAKLAERHLTARMIRRGIRVFRWEKSILHGKTILADHSWASLGSYNINRLSQIRSVELNADVIDPDFVRTLSLHLENLIHQQSVEITAETLAPLNFFQKWKARLAYYLVYFLMRLMFPHKRT